MSLLRTDPFVAEFDRLTSHLLGGLTGEGSPAMPVDVTRRADELVVRVDVPGVPADAVGVTLEDGVLTVSAERRSSYGDDEQVLLHERFDGAMTRRLRVPDWVDGERVEASHADGVLTVRLPVAERARPRTIAVRPGAATPPDQPQIDAA